MTRTVALAALVALACAGAPPPSEAPAPHPPEETSVSQPPGPPGPPPPPAPAEAGPVDPSSPKGRYAAWLESRGRPTDGIKEGTPPGAGTYAFFFLGPAPGVKTDAAAVGPSGIVAPGMPDGWREFLLSAPPEKIHEQVAWLNGAWGALAPDTAGAASVLKKHPAAEAHLTPPERSEEGDVVRFTAWYFEPPAMTPFRHSITASPASTDFQRTRLSDL